MQGTEREEQTSGPGIGNVCATELDPLGVLHPPAWTNRGLGQGLGLLVWTSQEQVFLVLLVWANQTLVFPSLPQTLQ